MIIATMTGARRTSSQPHCPDRLSTVYRYRPVQVKWQSLRHRIKQKSSIIFNVCSLLGNCRNRRWPFPLQHATSVTLFTIWTWWNVHTPAFMRIDLRLSNNAINSICSLTRGRKFAQKMITIEKMLKHCMVHSNSQGAPRCKAIRFKATKPSGSDDRATTMASTRGVRNQIFATGVSKYSERLAKL